MNQIQIVLKIHKQAQNTYSADNTNLKIITISVFDSSEPPIASASFTESKGTTYETKGYNNREDPTTSPYFHRCQNLKSHSDCISFQNSNTYMTVILTATFIQFHASKILELHTFKMPDSIYQTTRRSEARRLKPPIMTGRENICTRFNCFQNSMHQCFPRFGAWYV